MRIVTCPKCSSTRCSKTETLVGEVTFIKVLCRECGYYAKYKEFKEGIEVTINSNLDKINSELKKLSSDLEHIKSYFDI